MNRSSILILCSIALQVPVAHADEDALGEFFSSLSGGSGLWGNGDQWAAWTTWNQDDSSEWTYAAYGDSNGFGGFASWGGEGENSWATWNAYGPGSNGDHWSASGNGSNWGSADYSSAFSQGGDQWSDWSGWGNWADGSSENNPFDENSGAGVDFDGNSASVDLMDGGFNQDFDDASGGAGNASDDDPANSSPNGENPGNEEDNEDDDSSDGSGDYFEDDSDDGGYSSGNAVGGVPHITDDEGSIDYLIQLMVAEAATSGSPHSIGELTEAFRPYAKKLALTLSQYTYMEQQSIFYGN